MPRSSGRVMERTGRPVLPNAPDFEILELRSADHDRGDFVFMEKPGADAGLRRIGTKPAALVFVSRCERTRYPPCPVNRV